MKKGKKQTFDLYVSLGAACSCTETLRKAGLQFYSYPFDWLYGSDFLNRIKILNADFENWINKEDMLFMGERQFPLPRNIYVNKNTGIVYNHDFPVNIPLEDSCSGVISKYERRIKRLFNQIKSSKKVLFVYIEMPNQNENAANSALIEGLHILQNKFPETNISILYLTNNADFNFDSRRTEAVNEKITKTEFFYDARNKEIPYQVNTKELLKLFENYKISPVHLTVKSKLHLFFKPLAGAFSRCFSVTNEYTPNEKYKIIVLFGIKFKIRTKS